MIGSIDRLARSRTTSGAARASNGSVSIQARRRRMLAGLLGSRRLCAEEAISRPASPALIVSAAMKILYGVVGEGMGHAMRSRVVLEHLIAQGHELEIMASGRATDFLSRRFSGVNRIHGLHMIYDENRVR